MLGKSKIKDLERDMESMHMGLSTAFTQVKDELTEHLDSINQNTAEFEVVSQRMAQLETMIEKVNERVDELTAAKSPQAEEKIQLSLREQEFFLTLYTFSESYSATEFARNLSLTEELIHALAHKLIGKGIPVMKETNEIGQVCYVLERNFKELQAKQGLVHIHPSILEQFGNQEQDINY